MARHEFIDPATQEILELVIDETVAGEHGVAHPGCSTLGDVSLHHAQWFCADCHRQGPIRATWAAEQWAAVIPAEAGA